MTIQEQTEARIAKFQDSFAIRNEQSDIEAYRTRVGALQTLARDLAAKLDAVVEAVEQAATVETEALRDRIREIVK